MRGFIGKNDYRVMQRANNWAAPHWVRVSAMAATRAGDGWLWCLVGLLVLFVGDQDRVAAVGAAGLAGACSVLLFMGMKQLIGRERPCTITPHCWATLLPPDHFSFPSGHTMTAFAVSVAFSLFYPALAVGLLFCAFSIAVSRILLGMHFLSDVVAAMLLGAGLGWLGYVAFSPSNIY
ncbi:MAG: phosphatase PAP2 family protein [Acidobacteriota bacterium]|nr:phosphatase PAP2 family protein [Acidobacteriota bacterium]